MNGDMLASQDVYKLRIERPTCAPREKTASGGTQVPSVWNGAASCVPDDTAASAIDHDHPDQHGRGTQDSVDGARSSSCGDDVQRLLNVASQDILQDPVLVCADMKIDELLWRKKHRRLRVPLQVDSCAGQVGGSPQSSFGDACRLRDGQSVRCRIRRVAQVQGPCIQDRSMY